MIILSYLIYGCSSPMDLNTKRETRPVDGENYKMNAGISEMSFIENNIEKNFITTKSIVYIDTTLEPPRIWLRLVLEDSSNTASLLKRLTIRTLDINLDSMDCTKPYYFSGRRSDINKAQIKVDRGLNISNDTIVYTGSEANASDISFDISDYDNGIVKAKFGAKLVNKTIWYEYHDSTYTEYITVTRYDTTYDNQGNIDTIKIVTEKQPREITIKVEEEKRKLDSLYLTGKFKLTF